MHFLYSWNFRGSLWGEVHQIKWLKPLNCLTFFSFLSFSHAFRALVSRNLSSDWFHELLRQISFIVSYYFIPDPILLWSYDKGESEILFELSYNFKVTFNLLYFLLLYFISNALEICYGKKNISLQLSYFENFLCQVLNETCQFEMKMCYVWNYTLHFWKFSLNELNNTNWIID